MESDALLRSVYQEARDNNPRQWYSFGMSANAPTIDQLIEPVGQCLTREVAERLVALRANPELQVEVDRLAEKANQGTLTADERTQYEQYVSFAQFVTLLQIEARELLDGRSGAA